MSLKLQLWTTSVRGGTFFFGLSALSNQLRRRDIIVDRFWGRKPVLIALAQTLRWRFAVTVEPLYVVLRSFGGGLYQKTQRSYTCETLEMSLAGFFLVTDYR
jgi:hypothetical protein